jgi:ribose transport system substrate-binding protein
MDEAAYDMNVDLTFETLLNYNDPEEQLSVIKREIDNNAQAIVLAPAAADIYSKVNAYDDTVLLIEIESDTKAGNVAAGIHPDNYEMGHEIGTIVANRYRFGQKMILLKNESSAPYLKERERGFNHALGEAGQTPLIWQSEAVMTTDEIKSKILLEEANMLIALDAVSLKNAADAVAAVANDQIKVFGVDCTDEIIALTEQGIVDTTVAQNTFNMGYLSIKSAVEALNKKELIADTTIEHMVISIDDIYTKSNEHIIFPIVR